MSDVVFLLATVYREGHMHLLDSCKSPFTARLAYHPEAKQHPLRPVDTICMRAHKLPQPNSMTLCLIIGHVQQGVGVGFTTQDQSKLKDRPK